MSITYSKCNTLSDLIKLADGYDGSDSMTGNTGSAYYQDTNRQDSSDVDDEEEVEDVEKEVNAEIEKHII